jgi:hypothetical protein
MHCSKDRGEETKATVTGKTTCMDPSWVQSTNRLRGRWKGLPMPGRVLPTSLPTCLITGRPICVYYAPRANRNVTVLTYLYGREGEVCPDLYSISVDEWEHDSGNDSNRKQRTIKMDSDGKTLLFIAAIIFNLIQNLEVHTVKWSVPNGVGKVVA